MRVLSCFLCAMLLCGLCVPAMGEAALAAFDASPLAAPGDTLEYGPYTVEMLGEGIYHLEDGIAAYKPGYWLNADGSYAYDAEGNFMNNCSEMYLVLGDAKALLIDLSNSIARDSAATAVRNIVAGLAGKRTLEVAITHGHPDHVGMAKAFVDTDVPIYFPEGDYAAYMEAAFGLAENRTTPFVPGETKFDLGGRVLDTVLVQGHTAASTVFVLEGENVMISGDAIGSGMGVWIFSADGLAQFVDGMENLIAYINANFDDAGKAALKIYSGHAWQYGKWVEGGADWLDWQYVQDMGACIALLAEGAWLTEGSGLVYEDWGRTLNGLTGDFVHGTAGISAGLKSACDFAGVTTKGTRKADYPWGKDLAYDDFVSQTQAYAYGSYLDLYEVRTFDSGDEAVGEMTYYVYDPIAHGADADGTYPVILWLHGSGNALDGEMAVPYSGAEAFASPEYQEAMGGAYIICPLANETRDEKGQTLGNWMTTTEDGKTSKYSAALKGILDTVMEENADHIGKVIVSGTSAGGYGAWRFILDHTDAVDACLLMAAAYLPTEDELNRIDASGMRLWITHGYRDELVTYDRVIEPILTRLMRMENVEVTILDWVRNADHGVATINFGLEMGQHCICAQIGANMIFADGTPADISHPDGVTGWIRDVVK